MSTESIRAFAHVGIRVHELERSRRFYEDVLGFAFVAGPLGPEPAAILVHPSGVTINLILNADAVVRERVLEVDADGGHYLKD